MWIRNSNELQMILNGDKITDICDKGVSLQTSMNQIAADHAKAFALFIIVAFILIGTIIALFIAYRWFKRIQKYLDAEKQKYQKSFYFLKSILNTIPDKIYCINKNGKLIPILELENFSYKTTFNKTTNINTESTIYTIWCSSFASKIYDSINEVLRTKEPISFDFNHLHDKLLEWHSIQMVPFGENEVHTTVRNITEQHLNKAKQEESEFLFQAQFDYGLNGIGILSETLEWKSVNKQLADILGYSISEIHNLKWQQIIIPEDSDYDEYLFSKNKEKIGIILNTEKRFLSKDGIIVFAHCTIIQYFNEEKNAHSYFVTIQDISFRKEHERTILDAIIKTEEKERTNFAQEIHDGVGPILSSIKMYIQ